VKSRRIIVRRRGGPQVLESIEENACEPRPGEARVRILTAGVSYADMLMREGVHPEKTRFPFTPGWDLVGLVDKLGEGVSEVAARQVVAALPIHGGYAQHICLPQDELIPVPADLDPAEAVCLILNYVTAYQMMYRIAHAASGQRVLIHGAAGGIGTALLQLGRRVDLEMYGTASPPAHSTVSGLGAIPIDYRRVDFVEEIRRLTSDGVDIVFDGIGGSHVWRSFKALRPGGRVIAYGLTSTLRAGKLAGGLRHRFRGLARIALYVAASFFLPGKRRVLPYSIQNLKRSRPAWFREDLMILLDFLRDQKIQPIIAEAIPLSDAKRAHELLGQGSVKGKVVLVCDGAMAG
jgi:NADPH2:quinone reductase